MAAHAYWSFHPPQQPSRSHVDFNQLWPKTTWPERWPLTAVLLQILWKQQILHGGEGWQEAEPLSGIGRATEAYAE